ncbi:hypothetical protein HD599_001388 [Conyzicola lurida]|uniref:Uncharacterized protein n=1 Tax=Conyzicola lurida TaxID=1172621 RepID=A0A841ANF0_9MICO|nr:hypothetical protein [Conyzicola lurida]MBB5843065.1 hypothetical protein [Conyzicola lurida]
MADADRAAAAAGDTAAEIADRVEFLASLSQTTFYDVEAGSVLADDGSPAAAIARASLRATSEHLTAVHGYTEPAFAALRDALEAAASVVWLLEPDEQPERQRRTARLADEDASIAAALDAALNRTPAPTVLDVDATERVTRAADYVEGFTASPGASAVIVATWRALGAGALGRHAASSLPAASMLAGALPLVLDVAETAASLWHSRAVPAADEPVQD